MNRLINGFIQRGSLFNKEYHDLIYILGLMMLASSLTLSYFMMSVAQFTLLGNWLLGGYYREKLVRFLKNKVLWIFTGIYLLHLAGIFYSHDLSYALKDLRIKLPFLALPIIFATSGALSQKQLNLILIAHVLGSLVATLISIHYYATHSVEDMREISRIISLIRFSLNLCLDIFILVYFFSRRHYFGIFSKIVFVLIALWFILFMLFTESFTGITVLIFSALILSVVYIFQKSSVIIRWSFLALLFLVYGAIFIYFRGLVKEFYNIRPVDNTSLEYYTPYGNRYVHDIGNYITDNGNYTWYYVCYDELGPAWNQRSSICFDSTDQKKQPLKFTLVRYLTSKGLRKDKNGVSQLSNQEIALIENGVANFNDQVKGNFRNRVLNTLWEYENYKHTNDARGRSVMQRIELWQTSFRIINHHLFFGVGTGDVKNIFASQLYLDDSKLKDSGLRSHNQFLTIFIAFGLFGFIVFIFCLFYPPVKLHKFQSFLFLAFFIILLASMLAEDTLESQPGATFAAFFYSLFVFAFRNKDD